MQIHVLTVDDDVAFRRVLIKELKRRGFEVDGAQSGEEALEQIEQHTYHVVLLDMLMPGLNGMETLARIKQCVPSTEVILLTAYATLDEAVECTKQGAFHYLTKPAQLNEMESLIRRAYEKNQLEAQNLALREQIEQGTQLPELIGESPPMQQIKTMLRRVATSDATVLLQGESGVGKELAARSIHSRSGRKNSPFVIVDCSALQESLIESELFGHERGAYTGATTQKRGLLETAHGGTLFVDEIGDASPTIQAKLLRVLETGEFRRVGGIRTIIADVRIIAATNRDLQQMVQESRFRADLYHRLNVVSIQLPPLRERREDIHRLAPHLLAHLTRRHQHAVTLSPEVLNVLMQYDWPGNVRELRNVLERAVILTDGNQITLEALPPNLTGEHAAAFQPTQLTNLAEMETQYIQWVLQQVGGQRKRASEILQIDPKTLYRKLKETDG